MSVASILTLAFAAFIIVQIARLLFYMAGLALPKSERKYIVYAENHLLTFINGEPTFVPVSGHFFKFKADARALALRKQGLNIIAQVNVERILK